MERGNGKSGSLFAFTACSNWDLIPGGWFVSYCLVSLCTYFISFCVFKKYCTREMETQDCYGLLNKCFSYQGWTVIDHIQRSEPARAAFNPALNFPRYIQKVVFSFFIDGTLKQSDQRCYFLSRDGGVKWRDGVIEGGKIWDHEEEEDKKRESRTETWLTDTAFWVVCSRALSCVGPDGEVLLSSSVNTVCYEPIQPIQHRCPGVTDRELSFLTSNDDFSSSRALQAWLDAVKTDLLCFCWLLI